jgi:trans-aconitate methyltransferase
VPRWDPNVYAAHGRFVSDLGAPVVELLNPKPGERILDLGCGDGALTEKIAARGCSVVGLDSSEAQIAAARTRGLDARTGDARDLPFSAEFDAVFSNAVLHWIQDVDRTLAGVYRALKPGGRFVAEMGGAGCVASVRDALHASLAIRGIDGVALDPWYFPTMSDYDARLKAAGFTIQSLTLFPRPTPLPGDIANWLDVFAQTFLDAVPTSERQTVIDEIRHLLAFTLLDPDGVWVLDYVRLRLAALRPAR